VTAHRGSTTWTYKTSGNYRNRVRSGTLRIIVLGGTRFVGRAICSELTSRGHELLLVHRGRTEPEDLAPAQHLHTDRASWPSQSERLAAFGAEAAVDVSALNGSGAASALRALPPELRLVAISSGDVYRAYQSLHTGTQTDPVPLSEQSPLRRVRHIDSPNWENLEIEEHYLTAGATVLRLGAVYGEWDYQHRFEFVLRRVRAGRRQLPIGPGTFLFSRIYVRDVATAVAAVLERDDLAGEIFNIAESTTSAYRLFAEQIIAAADGELELVSVPEETLPEELKITGSVSQHLLLDASKARRVLQWKHRDPQEALRQSVGWHLDNPPTDASDDFGQDDVALKTRS
jgi:nucleoside-diphosphate-sugar epimerase